MPRIRTIKPELPQSESMGRVSREARLTFILLWTLADDSGRLRGSSRLLASLLYPFDEDAADLIDGWLDELQVEKCIIRYNCNGNAYIEICNWLQHQKIDKPSESRLPPFANVRECSANGSECSSLDLGPRTMDLVPSTKEEEEEEETVGRVWKCTDGEWTMPKRIYERLTTAYPKINFLEEMNKIRTWFDCNQLKPKNAMARFFNGWFVNAEKERTGNGRKSSKHNQPTKAVDVYGRYK